MCTRSSVRVFITQLITCLENASKDCSDCATTNPGKNRTWADIVADRLPDAPNNTEADFQHIQTVITTRSSQHHDGTLDLEKKKPANQPVRTRRNHKLKKPTITIWGDSHARGIASEMIHQLNYNCNVTGYVKPNAGLYEVLNTGHSNLSRMSKRDTIVVMGGSNDFERNTYNHNLSSLGNFLEDTQYTNVILTDIPMRYDKELGSPIHKSIMNYNKQLHRVAKSFKHVTCITVPTNRSHYTTHGSHLNRAGKESLVSELIKHLPNKRRNPNTAVFRRLRENDPPKKKLEPRLYSRRCRRGPVS
jgi:hypothetical protein